MKKVRFSSLLTALLLIVALCFTLASCGGGKCTHLDKNDDGKCDECEATFKDACDVHKDATDDGKCDVEGCGKDFTDACDVHKDADDNGTCDTAGCGKDYTDGCDAAHKDENDDGECDVGGENFSDGCDAEHVDADDNGKCDVGGENFSDGCDLTDCVDANDDGNCDACGKTCDDGCDVHRDADDNGECDKCGEAFEDGDEPEPKPEPGDEPLVEDFEGEYETEEMYWECTHAGHVGAKDQTVTNITFPSGTNATLTPASNVANLAGATAEVVEAEGNKYLKLTAPTRVSDRDRSHQLNFVPEQLVSEDEIYSYVIDFDIFLDSTSTYKSFLTTIWRNTDGKYVQMNSANKDNGFFLDGVEFAKWDTWTNIRMEFYPSEPCIVVYVDGLYSGSITNPAGDGLDVLATAPISSIGFGGNNGGYVVAFDNVSCYYSDVEYEEPCRHRDKDDNGTCDKCDDAFSDGMEPEVPETPEIQDFETAPEYEEMYWECTRQEHVAAGLPAEQTATNLIYDNLSVQYQTSASYSNLHGATATIETEGDNKYLRLNLPKRVGPRDRAHVLVPDVTYVADDANAYVFEADLRLHPRVQNGVNVYDALLTFIIYEKPNATGTYMQLTMCNNTDGTNFVSFGGCNLSNWGEWFTFRMVLSSDDGSIRFYVKNGDVWEYRGYYQNIVGEQVTEDGFLALGGQAGYFSMGSSNSSGAVIDVDNVSFYQDYVPYDPDEEVIDPLAPVCEHRDADDNYKCDKCGFEFTDDCDVKHLDDDGNLVCDLCETAIPCEHVDEDGNGICDIEACGAAIPCEHVDEDENGECDKCTEPMPTEPTPDPEPTPDEGDDEACEHVDENEDGACDSCGDTLSDTAE